VGDDEVEKLLRRGEGWLAGHPEREEITRRYLRHRPRLTRAALARLVAEEEPDPDAASEAHANEEAVAEQRIRLNDLRLSEIMGRDVSYRALEIAHGRLRMEDLPRAWQGRVRLIQGSLIYRDARLAGYDAAAVVEVIEHLDPPRLAAFERVLFGHAATPAPTPWS
jgi:hypothetical protein